jgi:hypothetical protein
MVRSALKVLAGTNGEVVHANIENWDYPVRSFD